jgi:antitoxin component of RelBE/YafQ-DinJ toxin-antitoxin module
MAKRTSVINFRIRPEYKEKLRQLADEQDLTVSDVLNILIKETIKKSENKEGE